MLSLFNNDKKPSEDGEIQVFLDQTDFQKNVFIRQNLYETYFAFMKNLMTECGKSRKVGNLPIVFEAAHGELNFDLKSTMLPGFLLASFFSLSSYVLSISMISERVGGVWNRCLVAGARPVHFLLSHLLEGMLIMTIQFIEYMFYIIFLLSPMMSLKATVLLSTLVFLNGTAGLLFGLLISIVMGSVLTAFALGQFLVFPVAYVSGEFQVNLRHLFKILQIIF